MKRVILALMILSWAGIAQAQCVAEITDVIQDPIRGSIIVKTRYTLNGEVVQNGQTRYLENSKETKLELIAMIKDDIAEHCENLIRRIPENREYLNAEKLKQQKKLTDSLVSSLKAKIVGHKESKTEAVDEFKGKTIKVKYDKDNTVSNTISVIE